MSGFDSFRVGDRVHHNGGMGLGVVTAIDNCVHVEYDHITPRGTHWHGEYDRRWFEMYPQSLEAAAKVDPEPGKVVGAAR